MALICGGSVWYLMSPPPVNDAVANQPFVVSEVPVTQFPARGAAEEIEPGVDFFEVVLPDTDGDYSPPGNGGRLWIYVPRGETPAASRPCILIAPAGSSLIDGKALGEGSMDEHIPYAQSGCVVVAYELDGFVEGDASFGQFEAAQAGLVNGRNALEYTLKHLDMVDPKQIYAAGHSSAATAALLFAEHEPRLAGCMAYAPAVDVEKFVHPVLRRMVEAVKPGINDSIARSSPARHIAQLKCPTFLFVAEDDATVSASDIKKFHADLQAAGGKSILKTVPAGGHYMPMIDEGIPAAIEWLKTQRAVK